MQMKKSLLTAIATACLLSASQISHAAIIFSDDFNRANQPLSTTAATINPLPTGSYQIISGANGQNIVSNSLLIRDNDAIGGTGGTGDFGRGIGTLTTGSVFAGFDLTVDAADLPSSAAGQYFSLFAEEYTGANANFVSRVFLGTGTAPNQYTIGIARGAGAGATTTFSPTELVAGTTYRIVHGYDIDNNIASLGIASAAPTLTNNTGLTDPAQLTLYATRISAGTDGDKFLDNLVVATTYSEAFGVAVPEPTSMALVGVACAAGFGLRLRRKNVK